jgi:hypothetical protein
VLAQIASAWTIEDVKAFAAPFLGAAGVASASLAARALQRGLGPIADRVWGASSSLPCVLFCFVFVVDSLLSVVACKRRIRQSFGV